MKPQPARTRLSALLLPQLARSRARARRWSARRTSVPAPLPRGGNGLVWRPDPAWPDHSLRLRLKNRASPALIPPAQRDGYCSGTKKPVMLCPSARARARWAAVSTFFHTCSARQHAGSRRERLRPRACLCLRGASCARMRGTPSGALSYLESMCSEELRRPRFSLQRALACVIRFPYAVRGCGLSAVCAVAGRSAPSTSGGKGSVFAQPSRRSLASAQHAVCVHCAFSHTCCRSSSEAGARHTEWRRVPRSG